MNRINNDQIKNNVNHQAPKDAYEVVTQKNQFSTIEDPNNKNWKQFKPNLN